MSVEAPQRERLRAKQQSCHASSSSYREFEAKRAGYWEKLFAGYEWRSPVRILGGRGDERSGVGWVESEFGMERAATWIEAAERHGLYFETMAAAAWAIVVSRYEGTDDVGFRTAWAGRENRVVFPMRCKLRGAESTVRVMRALERQGRKSMAWVSEATLGTQEAMKTVIAFDAAGTLDEGVFEDCPLGVVIEMRRGAFRLHYDEVLPSERAAERMLEHLANVLDQLTPGGRIRVSDVCLLTEDEQARHVDGWNRTAMSVDGGSLHARFLRTVSEVPGNCAAQIGQEALTYDELDLLSGRLAYRLRHNRGVTEGQVVAIVMERSLEFAVAMLGILKAGGVVLPIDSQFPEERRDRMMKIAGSRLALVRDEDGVGRGEFAIRLSTLAAGGRTLSIACSEDDPACILFTSGSTAEPKGVVLTHGGLLNNACACIGRWELGERDVALQFSNVSCDVLLEEVWTTWLSGGRLVFLEERKALASFPRFSEWVRRRGITVLNLPTAFWHSMVEAMSDEEARLPVSVRLIVVGGEQADATLYEKWRAIAGTHVRWVNAYGPTEASVTTTMFRDWVDESRFGDRVPIGRPTANAGALVVDQHGNPQPVGVPGELWISGAGVADRYLGESPVSAGRFISNRHRGLPGNRIYRTGDMVFADDDGQIYFLGRADRQLKVRGFRIEPGEVETILQQHPGVRSALLRCVGDTPKNARLIAYVTPDKESRPSEAHLLAYLRTRLPAFMEPHMIILLPHFPRLPNGKIDVEALPVEISRETSTHGLIAKKDEKLLAEAWQATLEARPEHLEDDFFEMGGDSLKVITLIGMIHDRFEVRLPVAMIYNSPTLGLMIDRVREAVDLACGPDGADWNSLVTVRRGEESVRPLFLVHGIGGGIIWGYRNLAEHLPEELPVIAISSRANDGLPEFEDLASMVSHYIDDLKRRQPMGPYRLGGYCLGGNIAQEMARQLKADGEEVELLLLIDAYPFEDVEGGLALHATGLRQLGRSLANVFHKLRNAASLPAKRKLARCRRLARWGWREVKKRIGAIDPVRRLEETVKTLTDVEAHSEEELKLWEHHLGLFEGNVTGRYDGHTVLLRTRSQPVFSDYAEDLGWGRCLKSKVVVRRLPGHHESIFLEPGVRTTALHVRNLLGEDANTCGLDKGS